METSKLSLIDATRTKDTLTSNGALTNSTSLSACVDMFFLAGASRRMPKEDIIQLFASAYAENPDNALKILFWSRDARGGAGERKFFTTCMIYLRVTNRREYDALLEQIPVYGYYKDIFNIAEPSDECILEYLHTTLTVRKNIGLAAKWFPRKGPWFSAMHKFLEKTPKEFRKFLVSASDTVEQKMCAKEFDTIDYSKVPSIAMNKYRKAFEKQSPVRFNEFIDAVNAGDDKINASVLFPNALFDAYLEKENRDAIKAQWDALPDYMEDSTERILPVCDVSGSMFRRGEKNSPISVSVSLGCYISERNKSIFKDAFITFSSDPKMQYLKGDHICQRFEQLAHAEWGMSTDLQAVFQLLLTRATQENIPEDQMPTKILIISDMEFNEAVDSCYQGYNKPGIVTNLDSIRMQYEDNDYKMPEIIFWNVEGRRGNVPATHSDPSIGLVSGFSPSILKSVLAGKVETPLQLMLRTIKDDRYNPISSIMNGL